MKSYLAVAVAIYFGLAATPASAEPPGWINDVLGAEAAETWRVSWHWILERYPQAPALVLGVAAALALPLIAMLGLVLQVLIGRAVRRPVVVAEPAVKTIPARSWGKSGQIEVVGLRSPAKFAFAHDLVRIGRADDNDIRLAHNTVHRYHAVVEKTPDMLFTIVDLSGGDGNGVRVRGVPVTQARLADGDEFEVGKVSMRFHLTEVH